MSDLERLRQVLPFAAALYLAGSAAQLQAIQPAPHVPRANLTLDRVVSSLKWHALEMAKNERSESLFNSTAN